MVLSLLDKLICRGTPDPYESSLSYAYKFSRDTQGHPVEKLKSSSIALARNVCPIPSGCWRYACDMLSIASGKAEDGGHEITTIFYCVSIENQNFCMWGISYIKPWLCVYCMKNVLIIYTYVITREGETYFSYS